MEMSLEQLRRITAALPGSSIIRASVGDPESSTDAPVVEVVVDGNNFDPPAVYLLVLLEK